MELLNILSLILSVFSFVANAYRYDPQYLSSNLNTNITATEPVHYWGEWAGHKYTPSPSNWRFPFYTLFLDRFVNGDPFNDNINGTLFEHDINSNQMRFGGDVAGLIDTLDYLQGMGIRGLYIAGSVFLNLPWEYDGYSPVDLSLLDPHFADLSLWQVAIDEIHARGMYVVLDNTFATLSDLIGFDGFLNTTTPFTVQEHQVQYKSSRQYLDFSFGNTYNDTCTYPRLWNETGFPVDSSVTDSLRGCYDSDFDQYGDTEAFGVFPDWRRQLSKFASVQDRLREWHPPVRAKLENFYCMLISQLDVDGFRYDKATQSTVDALGFMNDAMRTCAKRFGKTNFFLPGEITGGNTFGSIYIGRGRQPDMLPNNLTTAIFANHTTQQYSIREPQNAALDSAAFHYTVYRTLTRFLGMDGNLEAGYDAPRNWVDMWNTFLLTNDFTNANTGEFDPRHMMGATNQDVFRWPAIKDGVHKQLLGLFIATIHMPGIPLLLWGEEQAFYVLDNTANNYIFGRQPIAGSSAWQSHGCYSLGSEQYFNFPVDAAHHGCEDDTVSYDHRDPSSPVRNIIKRMFQLRDTFPVLNDGFWLQQLSNQTFEIVYPGSSGVATETGIWSVMRSGIPNVQNFNGHGEGNVPVWLVYSNLNDSKTFEFNCADPTVGVNNNALIAPFDAGTHVKNLFYPYDEYTLGNSSQFLGINGSSNPNGCLKSIELDAYSFRAFVPFENWIAPSPMITQFFVGGNPSQGHDARLLSNTTAQGSETVRVEFRFSQDMDCDSVTNSIIINSTTVSGFAPVLNKTSVQCGKPFTAPNSSLVGSIASVWSWSADLEDVENGIHAVTVKNASVVGGKFATNAVDHFMFRIGQANNPMVFPRSANYSSTLLQKDSKGNLYLNHAAAGADLWRYSTNFGSSFNYGWMPYTGGNTTIVQQEWSGTKDQEWSGQHVRVEYWSRQAGSSDHVQQGDLDSDRPRRYPHMFLNGPYNLYGFDAGLENRMTQDKDGLWERHFQTEWPTIAQINVWGLNPDGLPDQSFVLGDADGDSVLDRLPPSALSAVVINITSAPPMENLGWKIVINDGTLKFSIMPSGSSKLQLVLFILLWILPIVTASAGVYAFMKSFYQVKHNQIGITEKSSLIPTSWKKKWENYREKEEAVVANTGKQNRFSMILKPKSLFRQSQFVTSTVVGKQAEERRTVLIATMEYDIEDWKIKIKIGGLGVMAQLMGKALGHQDLIWVVPCVGGVEYPMDTPGEPMKVTILGIDYSIQVQYHKLNNITYVLLDAPVFRQQTQKEPYPARMDDLESAIYYSAWNQCIAQAIKRFPEIDLYHINDYHGCIAPLYLLPTTIPVCLSLHNAEFQGLWPMRTPQECHEVFQVYNLNPEVVQRFVQFGEVFNLLHAGASYLRVYQQGFGAVGVSKKYGRRAHLRYPIFWGLRKVGQLANPDPTDTSAWDGKLPSESETKVDPEFEAQRPELKRQAQEWAGLEQDPNAELFVFVGRWSMQKGVDLIADVFPTVLKEHPQVQLICIGPVIDLYGKFAARKLERLMELYPKRVYSKPVFTALPPYIFSGAEFALIPSRDEPFGLVAVEFGRKGALGVGARVGGLGNMPGWWYTIESMTTQHLIQQFRQAIDEALASKPDMRAIMRARSAKQRFPVAQWVEDLEILQSTAIRVHGKGEVKSKARLTLPGRNKIQSRPVSRDDMSDHSRSDDESVPSTPKLPKLGFSFGESSTPPTQGIRRIAPPSALKKVVASDSILSRLTDGHSRSESDNSNTSSEGNSLDNAPANTSETPEVRVTRFIPDQMPSSPPSVLSSPALSRNHSSHNLLPYSNSAAVLSVDSVVGEKKDFNLQQVDPFFTDSQETYLTQFGKRLDGSDNLLESETCIEEFLTKSEKDWFNTFLNAKLGRLAAGEMSTSKGVPSTRASSTLFSRSNAPSFITGNDSGESKPMTKVDASFDEFLLGDGYEPPKYLRKWMQLRVGDWPIYSIFLAIGQILAANSYQITLLTGQIGESAPRVYAISATYLVASILYWNLFRRLQSRIVLSIPFVFYALAFLIIGFSRFGATAYARGWIMNIGSGCYAVGSASGSLFFALNFGDEGGSTVKSWIFRACTIQGTQQVYIAALWFWGSYLNHQTADGILEGVGYTPLTSTWKITVICVPIAFGLLAIGALIFHGLPNYYRQIPGRIPSFYPSIIRRKIILWFFVTVLVQNFFLSTQYGRSWSFLWNSNHISYWVVACLVILFFVFLWALVLWGFSLFTHNHSWLLPIFAIGLGAPRWAQMWWATSNVGTWLPWSGGYVASAILSRSVWLWLGLLDTIQGVGFGMILLSTMTRIHVTFTLITAQVLGAAMTAIARACAPNNIGPGPVFPDISAGVGELMQGWFWVGLLLNLGICIGFFLFFRKEQLNKP